METFAAFLETLQDPDHRERMAEVLSWIQSEFPQLVPTVKWNQPMFMDHGTYIIGFSAAKAHL